MDEISASVTLPSAVPAGDDQGEAYTGRFGARDRYYRAQGARRRRGFPQHAPRRAPRGMTIVVMFPKGVVAAPTLRDKADRWLDDNLGEAFGLAGLLVLCAFLYLRWTQVGRDPRAGPPFPRYEAPKGLGLPACATSTR
jgi:hypothetical protein